MEPTVLNVLLVILVAVGVWAVVELALMFRKARSSVEELTRSANETIEQVQPIISKVDGMVDNLEPSVAKVDPMVGDAQEAVGSAKVAMERVNAILGDVSEVSGTAAAVTGTVSRVADSAASGVGNVISRLTGSARKDDPASLPEEAAEGEHRPAHAAPPAKKDGYITYGERPGTQGDAAPSTEGKAATQGAHVQTSDSDTAR